MAMEKDPGVAGDPAPLYILKENEREADFTKMSAEVLSLLTPF